jgi:hypothetical protein
VTLPEAVAAVRDYLATAPARGPLSEHARRENLLATLWDGLPRGLLPGLLLALGATQTPGRKTYTTEPPCESLRKWLVWKRQAVPGVPAPHAPVSARAEYTARLVNWRHR